MNFGWPNAEIGWKMADDQLLFLAWSMCYYVRFSQIGLHFIPCYFLKYHDNLMHAMKNGIWKSWYVEGANRTELWLFKPGVCLVSWNCFCADVGICVCVSAPEATVLITSGVMWYDMDLIRLVKQDLQLLYSNCSRYR